MTPMAHLDLEMEIAALRKRRETPSLIAWFRQFRPFDRRSIREPHERDAYWANVQQRLAESDAAWIQSHRATEPPREPMAATELIG